MPKIAIFEGAARTLDIPGGVKMIQEYYRQMRKFGCNILAVVQQYDIIKDSPVRGAMIGNSKMFVTVGFIAQVAENPLGPDRSSEGSFSSVWKLYCRLWLSWERSKWLRPRGHNFFIFRPFSRLKVGGCWLFANRTSMLYKSCFLSYYVWWEEPRLMERQRSNGTRGTKSKHSL